MDKEKFRKVLIGISIIGLIFSVSISSYTLININNVYKEVIPLFDSIDLIKDNIDAFDENIDEFNLYLEEIDPNEYRQRIANMRSFVATLSALGLGGLVSDLNEDISRFESIISSVEELKLNLESAKTDFSDVKSSVSHYEDIKQEIVNFIGRLRLFVIGMMTYSIIVNGLLLYVAYYMLDKKNNL